MKPGLFLYRLIILLNALLYRIVGRTVGQGFFSFLVQQDHFQEIQGRQLFVSADLAGSYFMNLLGRWNEPETNRYLKSRYDEGPCELIDVGANVGEMTIDAYYHPNVEKLIVIEPHPICMQAIKKSIEKRNLEKSVYFFEVFVSDRDGTASFNSKTKNTRKISLIDLESIGPDSNYPVTTLDQLLSDQKFSRPILKIDVEGAEYLVMMGARNLIERYRPTIVFEWKKGRESHFTLDQVQELLGSNYRIYRLRTDGKLDDQVQEAWNCVAVA